MNFENFIRTESTFIPTHEFKVMDNIRCCQGGAKNEIEFLLFIIDVFWYSIARLQGVVWS